MAKTKPGSAKAKTATPKAKTASAGAAKRAEKKKAQEMAISDDEVDPRDAEDVLAEEESAEDIAADTSGSESDSEDGVPDDEAMNVDFSTLVGVGEGHDDTDDEAVMETMALSSLPAQVFSEHRNDEAALDKKLADIAVFDTAAPYGAGKLPFSESLSVTMPVDEKISDELAIDDLKRETKFAALATAAVHVGLERLRVGKIKFRRPGDYFAEMVKTDAHMAKVKARYLHQKESIEAAEKRRHNRDLTKNRKKVRSDQIEKDQEKKRRTKNEIEAVARIRKDRLHKRAEAANAGSDGDNVEDDEFPIDLLDIEQLDDENRFQPSKDIASGKKKAWSGGNKGLERGGEDDKAGKGTGSRGRGAASNGRGRGGRGRGGASRGDRVSDRSPSDRKRTGQSGAGIRKNKGPKKRLGRSRRKA